MNFAGGTSGRGIYHIHSDFSYDGTNSLEEIAGWARANRLDFVLLTEHDLGFDQGRFEQYRAACAKYSDGVLLIPGIEYEVIQDGAIIHIGAVGLPAFLDRAIIEKGLLALVEAIHRQGGLAVLHHPNNIKHVLSAQQLEAFDFVELWNSKFDCSFGPNIQFQRWLTARRNGGPYLLSADIHAVHRFHQGNIAFIDTETSPEVMSSNTIVAALRQRRYRCHNGRWTFAPDGTSEVPNRLYRLLPALCLVKKKMFRCARVFVPEKYRKAVYKFITRS